MYYVFKGAKIRSCKNENKQTDDKTVQTIPIDTLNPCKTSVVDIAAKVDSNQFPITFIPPQGFDVIAVKHLQKIALSAVVIEGKTTISVDFGMSSYQQYTLRLQW